MNKVFFYSIRMQNKQLWCESTLSVLNMILDVTIFLVGALFAYHYGVSKKALFLKLVL